MSDNAKQFVARNFGAPILENCASCAFGVSLDGGYGLSCRKKAPVVIEVCVGFWDGKNQMGPKTCWPEVRGVDFCGEWELEG